MRKIIIISVVGALVLVTILFRESFFNFSADIIEIKRSIDQTIIEEIKKEILIPPPLRALREVISKESFLTQNGVFSWTNAQRNQNGLGSLTKSAQLNLAATLKTNDMFADQYFEHVSPSGVGPEFWVDDAGYEYIVTGENLALGNFENDQELVQAWMDSPGHRANILNERYTEIGIAVAKGEFEGRETWITVQVFGLPLATCPGPNDSLKAQVEFYEDELAKLEPRLGSLKTTIEQTKPRDRQIYNDLVKEYNDLAKQYNSAVSQFKFFVNQYNEQVTQFNNCVKQ